MNTYLESTICVGFNRKRVVEVSGVDWVNSKDSIVSEVFSLIDFFLCDFVLALVIHSGKELSKISFNKLRIMFDIFNIMCLQQSCSFYFDITEGSKDFGNTAKRVLAIDGPAYVFSSKVVCIFHSIHLFCDWVVFNVHSNDSRVYRIYHILSFAGQKIYLSYNLSFLLYDVNNVAISLVSFFAHNLKVHLIIMKGSVSMFTFYK